MNGEPWKCPECGAKLVRRNLSHACGRYSVEGFLEGKGERARRLFGRFRALVAAAGPYEVAPAKTRVAFMSTLRFASVNRLTDKAIHVHFVLPRALESPRFQRIEHIGKVYVHHLRLSEEAEFDEELEEWLKSSYREYGVR